ncbi:MAG: LysM domain-containing protein [Pseudomonadota bacterium]
MKNIRKIVVFWALGIVLGQLAYAADTPPPSAGHSTSVPLAPGAPSSYVVQNGDTLWAISSKFLTQPWFWPEIWYLNPDIKNPHLIYPGDTLRLVYDAEGRPQIRLERAAQRGDTVHLSPQVHSSPLDQAITTIPFEIVAAFMSKPSVISAEDEKTLPYIVALGQQRVIGGMGDIFYARGVQGVETGARLNVVHVGDKLKDPESGKALGYQGVYTGTARLERAAQGTGKTALAKMVLTTSARETLAGDRLIRDNLEIPLDFVPHAPSQPVNGQIISVVDGVTVIGQYHVVIVNRGRRQGLEPGHVLAIWQRGDRVMDRGRHGLHSNELTAPFAPNVQLPSEKAGTFMVFRAYNDMSYGLVLNAASELHVGDTIKNP